MDEINELKELIHYEKIFLDLAMPKHAHTAQKIIADECCEHKCVYQITRLDIMKARRVYVNFYNRLNHAGKRDARYLFISMISSVTDQFIEFSSIDIRLDLCPDLLTKIFGFSYVVLMNGITSEEVITLRSRPWYSKTINSLSEALHSLARNVQFNSLNQVMLPPNYSKRTGIVKIPISVVRERMDLNLRERTTDTLTRCNTCTSIPEIIKASKWEHERREANEVLKKHHWVISQQRTIVDCLGRQSRDSYSDVTCCLMDGMSNKCSKLPNLSGRPKSIGDPLQLGLNLTTVQLCEAYGANLFRNIEFPILGGLFSQDSSFNLSLFFHGLSQLHSISTTIFLIMDSCRSNKSFTFLAGIGYFLSKAKYVRKVVLIFPTVGHTHMSVDAHFGTVSKTMAKIDIKDPNQYAMMLKTIPSVSEVVMKPTVFCFSEISEMMYKPNGLCSNGVIMISKQVDGIITYCSSLTMNSAQLLGEEDNQVSKKLFKDCFYSSRVSPSITLPDTIETTARVNAVLDSSPVFFSDDNKTSYKNSLEQFGTESFRHLMKRINSVPPKLPVILASDDSEPHVSILKYLEKSGISMGRVPKPPQFSSSQLL